MDTVKGKRASCPTIELNTTPSVVGNPVRTYTVASFNSGSWVLFPRVTQLSDHPPTPPPPPPEHTTSHLGRAMLQKRRLSKAGPDGLGALCRSPTSQGRRAWMTTGGERRLLVCVSDVDISRIGQLDEINTYERSRHAGKYVCMSVN